MVTHAPTTRKIVRATARRRLLAATIWTLGRTLAVAMVVALGVIAVGKVFGLGWATWVVVAVMGAGGLAAGLVIVSLRRTTMVESALWLDRQLGLHERLSSALSLSVEGGGHDAEFVRLAIDEAETQARNIRPRSVTPIKADWTWLAWPTAGAAAIAIALFVPALTWQAAPNAEELAVTAARTKTAERVARAADLVRDAVEPALGDVATPEELEAIERLERELAEGKADPSRASATAARSLEDIAQRLDETSRELARSSEDITSAAGNVSDSVRDSRVSELADALEDGDLERARDAARELMTQARELSPEQREELARDLERLADAIHPRSTTTRSEVAHGDQPPSSEQGRDESTRPSLDPDAPPPVHPPVSPLQSQEDPAQPEQPATPQTNQPQPSPPEAAQSPSEQNQRDRSQPESQSTDSQQSDSAERQPQNTSSDGKRDVSDSMRRLAEEMRGRQQQPNQQPQNQQQQNQQQQNQQQQNQQQQNQQQPDQQRNPSQQPGQQPTQQPGQQPSQQPGEQPSQQPGERPQTQPTPGTQPGQQPQSGDQPQPGTQPGQQPSAQPGQEPQSGDQPEGGQSPSQSSDPTTQPGGARPTPTHDAQAGDQPQPAVSDGESGDASQRPVGESAGGRETLEQVLDRLSRDQSKAREAQRRAKDMRETARELLENASPEEREAMERWALERMRERPPAHSAPSRTPWRPETETFDARPTEIPPDAAERVVARWFSNEGVDRSGAASQRETAEAVREAREGAERAIDQQVVPRRHADLVRRVFQRYAERTGAPADAPDAGPSRP